MVDVVGDDAVVTLQSEVNKRRKKLVATIDYPLAEDGPAAAKTGRKAGKAGRGSTKRA